MPPEALADVDLRDYNRLRILLRKAMPAEAFQPRPERGVAAFAVTAAVLALAGLVVSGAVPWYGCLVISLVIGQLWVTVGFVAHEALHRSVFRSRLWEDAIGWIGFFPFLITPGMWRAWHVQAHHGNTNVAPMDPDMMPSLEEYRRSRMARWVYAVTPGSGHWISYISMVFLFTMQGQLFLWHYGRRPELAKIRWNPRRERALTVGLILAWLGIAAAVGPLNSLYLIVLPMMISNLTMMSYIATNHWLRAADADHNNPFLNTTSVTTTPLFDLLHVNFSYHQEHHIFPQMNPKFAPLLRDVLLRLRPEAVHVAPHLHAIRSLYATPSLYLRDDVLVTAEGERPTPISEVDSLLRGEAPAEAERVSA